MSATNHHFHFHPPRLPLSSSNASLRIRVALFSPSFNSHRGRLNLVDFAIGTCRRKPLLAFRFLGMFRPPISTNSPLLQCGVSPGFIVADAADSLTQSNSRTELVFFSLFRELGINEKEAEFLLCNNPALKFTSLEVVRARVQSIRSVGIDGLAFSRLVLKRPDVLTAEEIHSLICFIRDDLGGKIEPVQLVRLLNSTEPTFFAGFKEKIGLYIHYGVSQEKLSLVLNNVNLSKAICLKSFEEIDRMLTYLSHFGGVDLIIRRPAILNYDLETQLIPRIRVLLELSGEDKDATATVLLKLPFILAYTVEHLNDHVEFLRSFAGLNNQEIFRIIRVYPNLFSASRQKKLHPRINFLKQCGLSSNEICKFLTKAPLFISLSFEENLAHKLVFLLKVGYENKTKELAIAVGAVTRCSCKNLQEVVGLFLKYGFTYEDILFMSKKHAQVLQYNSKSLEEKIDYLINEMGREIGELLSFPAFLGYKLDGRIKHRYEVKKKILGEGMSLNKLLSVSTATFSKKKKRGRPVAMLNCLDEDKNDI